MTSQESDHERALKAEFRMRCRFLLGENITLRVPGPGGLEVFLSNIQGYVSASLLHHGRPNDLLYMVDVAKAEEKWDMPAVATIGLPILRQHMILDDLADV